MPNSGKDVRPVEEAIRRQLRSSIFIATGDNGLERIAIVELCNVVNVEAVIQMRNVAIRAEDGSLEGRTNDKNRHSEVEEAATAHRL